MSPYFFFQLSADGRFSGSRHLQDKLIQQFCIQGMEMKHVKSTHVGIGF